MAELKANYRAEHWINDNAVPTGDNWEFDISDVVREMAGVEREKLAAKLAARSCDLDHIVDLAGFQPDHNGPFTVEIDVNDFNDFTVAENLAGARYVIADGENGSWTHILDGKNDVEIRFVYDREEGRVVYAEIPGGFNQDGAYFVEASDDALANIEDHLRNANEDALNNPISWGLHVSDDLPDWVPETPSPKM